MRFQAWLTLLVGVVHADIPVLHDFIGYQKGSYGHQPKQTYHTSNITSPIFNSNTWLKDLVAGDESAHLFLDFRYHVNGGPYIFRDDDLSLVYADVNYVTAMNTRVQNVKGKNYLSFWHGAKNGGRGEGFCVFYDDRYQLRYNVTVQGSAGIRADLHECQVTADGTVLLTAYEDKPWDLSSLGPNVVNQLADSCFQEVDIQSNELLFSWCSSDYFSPDLTFQRFYRSRQRDNGSGKEGLDTYHINSIEKTLEGNYLVSLRALKMITYVNGTSGKPIWNLGGKPNDFVDITPLDVLDQNPGNDGALNFGWQHYARFRDESLTQIIFFDNHNVTTLAGCGSTSDLCSRGRILQIDHENLTAELLHDYRSPHGLISQTMGSIQNLESQYGSTNVLIGWGASPEFTEHTIDGTLVRDVQYSPLDPRHAFNGLPGVSTYRVFKHPWHGYPTWSPNVTMGENGKLWVSWNGATEVKEWAVHGSDNEADLGSPKGHGYGADRLNEYLHKRKPLQAVARAGFETEIILGRVWVPYVKVAALDFMGNVIGTSDTVETALPALGCGFDCISLQSILFP